MTSCTGRVASSNFYCPASTLNLTATNQSVSGTTNGTTGSVGFSVGNADTLFTMNGGMNTAFVELGGTNSALPGCGNSFDWGLPFFYGRNVFTAIEQQPVTGTSYVGPFWAY